MRKLERKNVVYRVVVSVISVRLDPARDARDGRSKRLLMRAQYNAVAKDNREWTKTR